MTMPPRMSATKLALVGRKAWSEQGAIRSAEPIAVVGMGCRLPGGVVDPDSLWDLLMEGRDAVTEVPADRWDVDEWFDADPSRPGRIATRWGGFLDDIRGFDAAFFDISPREAERMDPQQRLALEVACEAVAHAGIPLRALRGTDSGVFFASYHNDYTMMQYADLNGVGARTLTGALQSVVANRISYALGLHGPSLAIDAACSSSLVATHLACQALRSRDCDVAIAGGVSVMITPHVTVALSKGGFMSPTGRCRTFDAGADGFVRSEGCGAVVLKRLADAIADGDRVLAVIRGSAVNQDGESTNLAAPNGLAQAALVRRALRNAGVEAGEVSLIEAHGTGTQLGDPIETDALADVFRGRTEGQGPCYLGSLKANLGHCEAAAGVAGLIKAVLCLQNRTVPPQVHFRSLNPHIDFGDARFRIVTEATEWAPPGGVRLVGVSSFGVGGTNAHVILEETPAGLTPAAESPEPPFLLPLSARSGESLKGLCAAYAGALGKNPRQAGLLVRGAARRRSPHREFRVAVGGVSTRALVEELERIAGGSRPLAEPLAEGAGPAFVFSGQGTQWPGMGLAAMEAFPVFRETLERVDESWRGLGGGSILEAMGRPEAESRLDRTDLAQVAIFAVQVGLTGLLASWGIRPSVVIGHSVGEFAAAHTAGMLELEEALRAVGERGRVMQSTFDTGRMISVRATEEEITARLREHGLELSLAALNSPGSVVLSGTVAQVAKASSVLASLGMEIRPLDVRFGFHSHLMADAARTLGVALGDLSTAPPRLPFLSTVTGRELDGLDADYLARNIRSPVRFAGAVGRALELGVNHFVELGPHPVLGRAILEIAEEANREVGVAFALHRDRSPALTLPSLAGRVFEWGGDPDWAMVDPGPCPPVPLPRYPWAHRPYWLPASSGGGGTEPGGTGRPSPSTSFPGRWVRSPALSHPVFELELDDPVFAAFQDHRIGERTLLPATGILELFRLAAEAAGYPGAEILDLGILHPIAPGRPGRLQVVLHPETPGSARVELHLLEPRGSWSRAAEARVGPSSDRDGLLPDAGSSSTPAPLSQEAFYALLERDGCAFGPGFRLLREVAADGTRAEGRLDLHQAPRWEGDVHPAVVDACAQLCVAVMENQKGDRRPGALLPWAVDRYVRHCTTAGAVSGRVTLRSTGSEGASLDVEVLDQQGLPVVRMEGWRLRRAPVSVAPIRQIGWVARGAERAREPGEGPWLVVPDRGGVGEAVAAGLEGEGFTVVRRPPEFSGVPHPPGDPHLRWRGVVYAAALDTPHLAGDVPGVVEDGCVDLLEVVQGLGEMAEPDARLLVLTRGCQPAGDLWRESLPDGGGVWGLARAIRGEFPELRCTSLDLDARHPRHSGGATDADSGNLQGAGAGWVVAEALATGEDHEVALRDGERWVARLGLGELETLEAGPAGPYTLVHDSPGTLDRFVLRPRELNPPGPGEVMVQVLAAGMNFRDVLTALGAYPGEARIGHECCGRVVAVGDGVIDLSEGDRVLVFWPGCFGSHVTAPRSFVLPAPRGMDPVAAATIPVVFGTAHHALHGLGELREGMSILIHSGAGGVGMAALELARRGGAVIYATAGSDEKRAMLRELGAAGVFDSRSPSFEAGLQEATEGEGVDLVLNSLIGEMIPAGLRCLRTGGMFIELGKREILSPSQVEAVRSDVRYVAFDLREEAESDPGLLPGIFQELIPLFENGTLRPLPVRGVRMDEAASAFRRMARAEHVGKLVLLPGGNAGALRRQGWMVVTGGQGSLGLATARWLALRGARHIALLGRGDLRPEVAPALEELAATGAVVRLVQVDVSVEGELTAALERLREEGLPITGVFHSAGVLDDALLPQLDPGRLARVLAPKVRGGWNLHRATLDDPLGWFVLYSAAGPVLNGAGQGNYAAANGFLDALATHRRGLGLPAVSVLWGPWAGEGMAAGLSEGQEARWRRLGLEWWTPETGTAVLDQLLGPLPEQILALRLTRRSRGPEESGASAVPGSGEARGLAERLGGLPPHRRLSELREEVQGCVTTILGREDPVPVDVPLRDLGLDSLSAIEVRNHLAVAMGQSLPATLAFDHPTVEAISVHLLGRLGLDAGASPPPVERDPVQAHDPAEAEVAALSDEEAERLLWEELQQGGAT